MSQRQVDRLGLGVNAEAIHDRRDVGVFKFDVRSSSGYTSTLHVTCMISVLATSEGRPILSAWSGLSVRRHRHRASGPTQGLPLNPKAGEHCALRRVIEIPNDEEPRAAEVDRGSSVSLGGEISSGAARHNRLAYRCGIGRLAGRQAGNFVLRRLSLALSARPLSGGTSTLRCAPRTTRGRSSRCGPVRPTQGSW